VGKGGEMRGSDGHLVPFLGVVAVGLGRESFGPNQVRKWRAKKEHTAIELCSSLIIVSKKLRRWAHHDAGAFFPCSGETCIRGSSSAANSLGAA
jgi:hypothetical protein